MSLSLLKGYEKNLLLLFLWLTLISSLLLIVILQYNREQIFHKSHHQSTVSKVLFHLDTMNLQSYSWLSLSHTIFQHQFLHKCPLPLYSAYPIIIPLFHIIPLFSVSTGLPLWKHFFMKFLALWFIVLLQGFLHNTFQVFSFSWPLSSYSVLFLSHSPLFISYSKHPNENQFSCSLFLLPLYICCSYTIFLYPTWVIDHSELGLSSSNFTQYITPDTFWGTIFFM